MTNNQAFIAILVILVIMEIIIIRENYILSIHLQCIEYAIEKVKLGKDKRVFECSPYIVNQIANGVLELKH
ncbi:MAG: hypothetical protein WD512_11230 [Candidatus Paceibacterota bacterium]